MTRHLQLTRSWVAAALIVAMTLSVTGLFGAASATVRITSPRAGAKVSGEIEIAAAVKTSANVSYVIFGVDGDRPYSSNSSPYRFALDTTALPDGVHRVFAEAYDNYGLIAASKTITIVVKNGSGAPVVAKKAAPTRMAEKPAPKRQVAAKPSAPASTVPAHRAALPAPETVTVAEPAASEAVASPTRAGAGPAPEPGRAVASSPEPSSRVSALAGSDRSGPAVSAQLSAPSGPRGHTIVLNGQVVAFDVAPTVRDGRLQAGFRALFTESGARVSWVSKTRTARGVSEALVVEVPIGSRMAKVNGQAVDMGSEATITSGRTIVPVRFFASVTGSALQWDSRTRVATLGARTQAVAKGTP